MSDRKVVLIDGNAAAYRAFFAIPELCTSTGRPTNAVLGFVRMIRQVRRVIAPTHWMAIFDGGLSAERIAVLPSYKAQRPSMPDGLRQQLVSIEEYLNGAGIPWVRKEGVEADDLLGVAARRAADAGAEVLILTSDKDFYQLVGEHIRILSAADVRTTLGTAEVFAKTGVKPEQIVEWLSLVGDSSDNIDGVPGVGAKTAAKLLGAHGSLEKLWNGLDSVKPDRIRNALALSKDIVTRNVNLIGLKLDMPLPELDWSAMAVTAEDRGRLMPFFEQLELRSLADTVGAGT